MALFNFGMNDSTNIGRAAATPNSPDSNEPIVGASDPQKSEEPEKSAFDKLNELLYPKKEGGKDGNFDPDKGNPEPPIDPIKLFENPEAVQKLMASMDFTKHISDDTLRLLESNDSKGITSLVNDTSKAAFLEALKFSSALNKQVVEDAVKRAVEQSKGQINESLGDYELNQAMPEISNPVIRLGLDAVKQQLKAQNPSMNSKELAGHLKTYLVEANKFVNPYPNATPSTTPADVDSWLDWVTK